MKVFAFLFMSILFLICCFSFVSAADIAYVVKNPDNLNSDEIAIVNILVGEGHSIDVLDDVSFDANSYGAVLVDEGVNDIGNIFDNRYFKTFFMSAIAAKKQGLSSNSGGTSGRSVVISNNENPVTENFSLGDLDVYSSQSELKYLIGCKPINSESLAYRSDSYNSVLLFLDIDSLLLDGSCTKRDKEIYERNLFFGLTKASNWNSDAQTLFLNSLRWLISGNDKDGDGYRAVESGGEDCDDNDADVHPGADELLDEIDQNCVNEGPVLIEEIGVIILDEGSELLNAVDLNEYLVDYDGDELSFEIYDSSESENINVYIGDGVVSFEFEGGWDGVEWIIFEAEDSVSSVLSNKVILASEERDCYINCSIEEELPEFNDIEGRMENNGEIEVNIQRPREGDKFDVGKDVSLKIEVENNIDEDLDFDMEIYLYDLTDDGVVDDWGVSLEVDDGDIGKVDFSFEVPEDLNEINDYAIFVKVVEEDGDYYGEDYVEIDVERGDNNVIVERIDILEDVVCGEYVDVSVRVFNIGKKEQGVYVEVKNLELGIYEKSEGIVLKEYGERDSKKELFGIKIPYDVEDGEYVLKATVYYDGASSSLEEVLLIEGCESYEESFEIPNVLMLSVSEPVKVRGRSFGLLEGMLIWSFVVLVAMVVVMVVFRRYNYSS